MENNKEEKIAQVLVDLITCAFQRNPKDSTKCS
jgi:hypothetical protein